MKEIRKWWQRKRIWLLIVSGVLFVLFIWSLPSRVNDLIVDMARAYADPEICQGALEIAKKNNRVKEVFGVLQPIGKMALFEGYVVYSNKADSVAITVNVNGNRSEELRSKMDVFAVKSNSTWEYYKIQIRIKKPIEDKETIPILNN